MTISIEQGSRGEESQFDLERDQEIDVSVVNRRLIKVRKITLSAVDDDTLRVSMGERKGKKISITRRGESINVFNRNIKMRSEGKPVKVFWHPKMS